MQATVEKWENRDWTRDEAFIQMEESHSRCTFLHYRHSSLPSHSSRLLLLEFWPTTLTTLELECTAKAVQVGMYKVEEERKKAFAVTIYFSFCLRAAFLSVSLLLLMMMMMVLQYTLSWVLTSSYIIAWCYWSKASEREGQRREGMHAGRKRYNNHLLQRQAGINHFESTPKNHPRHPRHSCE